MSMFRPFFIHSYLRRVRYLPSKASAGATSSGAIIEGADTIAGVSSVLVSSAGAISEAIDTMAGVSTVSVFSSGAITEGPDIMDSSMVGGGGASPAFKIIFGLFN